MSVDALVDGGAPHVQPAGDLREGRPTVGLQYLKELSIHLVSVHAEAFSPAHPTVLFRFTHR